jgi:hypothetical protein
MPRRIIPVIGLIFEETRTKVLSLDGETEFVDIWTSRGAAG